MEKDKIYSLLAVFHISHMFGDLYSIQGLCEVAEEARGEPFSTEVLETRVEELERSLSRKDKNEFKRLLQSFLSHVRNEETKNGANDSTC